MSSEHFKGSAENQSLKLLIWDRINKKRVRPQGLTLLVCYTGKHYLEARPSKRALCFRAEANSKDSK
ncbi:hypothetical protein LV84_01000 [Algoriphagus ratkowskyi]|uniref:Uncharacterized protein n=1 Tax=Algoriphagus ratkowskyi TaxID=57028 RepID=A0A2W7RHT6_9BACT|nr:hypothetical protein LV84_01000 [Algoriphagus ratkowskyi]